MYKSLYECECEFLTRKLTFRNIFEQQMLDDIQRKYPLSKRLVYVSQHPGGFLADAKIIQKLLTAGYKELELVFIESLLADNVSILQACLDFQEWCTQHKQVRKSHFFMSTKEYAATCKQDPDLRGHIFVTIDPDDNITTPNFESITFRTRFGTMTKKILRPEATFYSLYFQKVLGNPYRHMLIGNIREKNILLDHWYGVENLQEHCIAQIFSF